MSQHFSGITDPTLAHIVSVSIAANLLVVASVFSNLILETSYKPNTLLFALCLLPPVDRHNHSASAACVLWLLLTALLRLHHGEKLPTTMSPSAASSV